MAKTKVKQGEDEQPIVMGGETPEVVEGGSNEETETGTETPEVVEGGSNEETETGTETPEVVETNERVEVAEVSEEVKKVKIHTLEDIDCLIAGNTVSIRKDKDVEVSSDVAAILCYSKKAYRI